MATEEHLTLIQQGKATWNKWRENNPALRVDLIKADLHEANLMEANLRRAILREANLTGAHLSGADLRGRVPRDVCLFFYDLIPRRNSDFRFPAIKLDQPRNLDVLSLKQVNRRIRRKWCSRRDPPGKGLVGVHASKIDKASRISLKNDRFSLDKNDLRLTL